MHDVSAIAKELGIKNDTLRSWLRQFPELEIDRTLGKLRLNDSAADQVRKIAALKDQGLTVAEIREHIAPAIQARSEGDALATQSHRTHDAPATGPPPPDIEDLITAAITRAEGIAEKYARATHRIGTLEAENKALQQQLEASAEQLRLLPSPQQLQEATAAALEAERRARDAEQKAQALAALQAQAQTEAEATRRELELARQQIEQARAAAATAQAEAEEARQRAEQAAGELEQERKRGWWARLMGK